MVLELASEFGNSGTYFLVVLIGYIYNIAAKDFGIDIAHRVYGKETVDLFVDLFPVGALVENKRDAVV